MTRSLQATMTPVPQSRVCREKALASAASASASPAALTLAVGTVLVVTESAPASGAPRFLKSFLHPESERSTARTRTVCLRMSMVGGREHIAEGLEPEGRVAYGQA